ncbi:hypothetical protein [Maridesulfovibrio frigidus]|uniref:hypothetical protein n=1 Tax=Maridesulfovibrio frigidus TaxID=340956 RepID=UPI0004E122D4|nr:hypothetical protein [Maridesulfovibrio frigidus]
MISRFPASTVLLLSIIFMVSGCASRKIQSYDPDKVYAQFKNEYGNCNSTGMKAKASLYYSSDEQGHRTVINLWGNLAEPLRLDVRAGIGAYVAHIREDSKGLTAFYPEQKTAYSHSSPTRAVKLLGLPFPFALKDLAGLIAGCYPSLIPKSFDTMTLTANGNNLLFIFDEGPISSVTLTSEGLPVELTGRGELPWRMEMSSYELDESGKELPDKITVFTENKGKAILRIKSRLFTNTIWDDKSLEMAIPDGIPTIKLDRNRNNNIS